MTKKQLIGKRATSITPAGVEMAKTPSKGVQNEIREITGVFKAGDILNARRLLIDYSKWPDIKDEEGTISCAWISRVATYECLVRNELDEQGWVSVGALQIAED